jgi:tetratricopeptide (TPR) repeat protein
MFTGSPIQYPSWKSSSLAGRGWILSATISFLALLSSAQQNSTGSRSYSGLSSPFVEAETLLAQGRIAEAKQKTLEQLKRKPASIEGLNLLGIIESNDKDYNGARDAFEQALKINPRSTQTHNNLASLYVAEGKPDLARKEFQKVLSIAPANRAANYNLGLLLMSEGSPAKAIPHFLQVHPRDTSTGFNLVRAYLQAGHTTDALRTASNLSAEEKDDIRLHFTLGQLLAEGKQYKPAQLELEKANALQPETFEILCKLGEVYLQLGDDSKAELVLSRALKLKPDSLQALFLLADVYSELSRPVDALDLLVRGHKQAPENTDIILAMARVSMSQNYFEDAIPLLESGVKLAPERPDLHAALGESYFMSGRTEKALAEFSKLLELEPSARTDAFMGLAYRYLGRFEEARKYFEDGLKRDPHNLACLFGTGSIEERQGNTRHAEELFVAVLRENPNFADALLELANLRTQDKKFTDAAELLRKYVQVSNDPTSGYYKLAMVERDLHETAAAERDLNVFRTLSKAATGPHYSHLFDYLDSRSHLTPRQRNELDIAELNAEIQKHPGHPQDLYLLSEAYLKIGKTDEARQTIRQLDQISAADYRTQTGIGVLLARYGSYDDAIQHFFVAERANPDSDDVKFDLAHAYFRKGLYSEALMAAQKVSISGRLDDRYLALLGDIYAHLGDDAKSMEIFQDAINRNPDNDQYYLSLTLIELRNGNITDAEVTLRKGLSRVPGSGKLLWGSGLISVLRGNTSEAADRLERAVDLLPEWAGSYSTLGAFYYETGQIDKAREVLNRFKGSNAGGLDVGRIEEALSRVPASSAAAKNGIPIEARQQLLQLALAIADRTL